MRQTGGRAIARPLGIMNMMQHDPFFNPFVIASRLKGGMAIACLPHWHGTFRVQRLFLFLTLTCMVALSACAPSKSTPSPLAVSTVPPIEPTQVPDVFYQSSGGGEPRGTGYWLLWNSCAEGNQAETARANGGRAAGWIIMDDLLADPGILVGAIAVESCPQGVNLLQGRDAQGVVRQSDPAYTLAAQLLAAQLNLATGSEYCPAVDQAVQAGQLLLISLDFNGSGSYLGPPAANPDVETAIALIDQLSKYNSGVLCR